MVRHQGEVLSQNSDFILLEEEETGIPRPLITSPLLPPLLSFFVFIYLYYRRGRARRDLRRVLAQASARIQQTYTSESWKRTKLDEVCSLPGRVHGVLQEPTPQGSYCGEEDVRILSFYLINIFILFVI